MVLLSKLVKVDGGEVQILCSVEWGGGVMLFLGVVLFFGYYFNELLLKLLVCYDLYLLLFDVYVDMLVYLVEGDIVLCVFELKLLVELGFLFDLSVVMFMQVFLDFECCYQLLLEFGVILFISDVSLFGSLLIQL